MTLAEQILWALKATPEQVAAILVVTGEARGEKIQEVARVNGVTTLDIALRL
jgi:hypothetical protein